MSQVGKINGVPIYNTIISAFTYDDINKFTIVDTEGNTHNASINILSATTVSATTFHGDGSNLTGVISTDTYTTGSTLIDTTAYFDTNESLSAYTLDLSSITGATSNAVSIGVEWTFSTDITETDPTNKKFKVDNVEASGVTEIYYSDITNGGIDAGNILNSLSSGDLIYIQQKDNSDNATLYSVTGTPVDNVGWWTIPVTHESGDSLPLNNKKSISIFFGIGNDVDTHVTGATFSNNELTLTKNDDTTVSTFIEDFTGLTVNGSISATTVSATTYYGDGSNLTGISGGGSGSELTETVTVGENVVAGDLLYLSTDGKYWKADSSAESTSSTELRLADATILADATGNVIIRGQYTTTGLVSGSTYWVGTSGAILSSQPTGDGNIVRYVGTALDDTILEFNPDELYVEITSGLSPIDLQPKLINVSTNTTLAVSDYTANVTATATITLPSAVGIQGKIFNIKNSGTGTVTVNTDGTETIDGTDDITITQQYASITIQSNGTNWIII